MYKCTICGEKIKNGQKIIVSSKEMDAIENGEFVIYPDLLENINIFHKNCLIKNPEEIFIKSINKSEKYMILVDSMLDTLYTMGENVSESTVIRFLSIHNPKNIENAINLWYESKSPL